MLLINIDRIPGKEFEVLSMVFGSTVQSKHIGKDIGAALKTLVGGEIVAYTDMMNTSREIATNRMISEAEKIGADAIIGVRYSSSAVMDGASEVMAYGTAVKFKN